MTKKLAEMSLQELWQLFPIFLVAPKAEWEEWYKEEERRVKCLFTPLKVYRISHVGSTSVGTIWAKDIIDILLELAPEEDMERAASALIEGGYIRMSSSEKRMSFNRGYTEKGFADRVYHLHVRYAGDNDELYFRDYLKQNPFVAKEYEELKLGLWKKYEHDRDAYTDAKTSFIRTQTDEAKKVYGNRYFPKE